MVWEGRRREASPYPDQSTNEIARFGGLKLQIPAISNAPASEKQTPAQSLTGLFTDDHLVAADKNAPDIIGRFVREMLF